ncbi:MAG: alpha/beta hydrolase [Candidatus Omnitrophica bacterium]|nr:alpha/beta hydrolase [Candidatus Omnitrophota bacterium]
MLKKYFKHILILLSLVLIIGCSKPENSRKGLIAYSTDNTPISYSVYGKADTCLFFVHGWSCDSRYWDFQVPALISKYKVVTIDLAGHGHSGSERKKYTMDLFGDDVAAVINKIGATKVILIGHSMGGAVIAHAAQKMPQKVIGLIGVDTLHNVESKYTADELETLIGPFRKDFQKQAAAFVRSMFQPGTDPDLVDWVAADMSAAPSAPAISAISEYLGEFVSGDAAAIFKQLRLPVRIISADLWPIDYEANRRHMLSFNAVIMPKTGHFLMMERPKEFNEILADTIEWIME